MKGEDMLIFSFLLLAIIFTLIFIGLSINEVGDELHRIHTQEIVKNAVKQK